MDASSGGTRRRGTCRLPAPEEVAAYRDALLERFANPRIRHLLAQIAADGSQKLPIRILPVLRAERAAGRGPGAAAQVLAAWVLHLRGAGAPVVDVHAGELEPLARGPLEAAVRAVLGRWGPDLAADDTLVRSMLDAAAGLTAVNQPHRAPRSGNP